MNELTRKINSLFLPVAALIAYKGELDRSESYFLELRPIDEKGNMCEAIPVTMDFMNEIAANYSGAHTDVPHGVIPQNMLYADTRLGCERYIWYNPPRRRMMFFRETLNLENAEYNVPGIIYEVQGENLKVYAFKEAVPTERTTLFQAPFFNVTGASVCLGNGVLEKPSSPTYEQMLDYWERRFWLTEFSHLGGAGNPTRSNLVLVTKAAREAPFDLQELKPMKVNLKTLLR